MIREEKRYQEIFPPQKTVDELMKPDPPSGVGVEIKAVSLRG